MQCVKDVLYQEYFVRKERIQMVKLREDFTLLIILLILAFLLGRGDETKESIVPGTPGILDGYIIVVDPGHGGANSGAIGYSGKTLEKDNNLPIAIALGELLSQSGAQVVMARDRDAEVALADRVNLASRTGADILVSIHCNWNEQNNINGVATYYYAKQGNGNSDETLARLIQKNVSAELRARDIGIIEYEHYITSRTSIPSVIVEVGFMSNPEEEFLLADKEYQARAAIGIYRGIVGYLQNTSPFERLD